MRIARGLDVEGLGDGGVRVAARDWPWALWSAAPALVLGVPLTGWSAASRHWVELGGGLVFCGFGLTCVVLALAHARELEIRIRLDGVSLSGFLGAGWFRRVVDQDISGPVRLEIRPFAVPAGAPDLPDRGGDLVLVGRSREIMLARRVGPGWRTLLETAHGQVVTRIPALGT